MRLASGQLLPVIELPKLGVLRTVKGDYLAQALHKWNVRDCLMSRVVTSESVVLTQAISL